MTVPVILGGRAIQPHEQDQWLAWRREGIGASEAAAVCGVGPYGSPLEMYLRKIGELPPLEETPEMRRGKRLEPVIAAEYEDETGESIVETQIPVQHPERSWQRATLDALTASGRIVEFKSVGWRSAHQWGEPGSDEAPEHYLCQVQHQLAVTGAPVAHVAALIGGSDFRIYTVPRNEGLIERLTAIEAEFWQRVLDRDPPPASRPQDVKLLECLYPEASGFVCLGHDAEAVADQYRWAGERIKDIEGERAILKAKLLEAMGNADRGELPDGTLITRKIVHVREAQITRKAYSFVDLRIKPPKEAQA